MLETITATAPSDWASYLINGDASGIDDADVAAADAFCSWVISGRAEWQSPVGCEDAGFLAQHDAYHLFPFGADCQTYLFLIDA